MKNLIILSLLSVSLLGCSQTENRQSTETNSIKLNEVIVSVSPTSQLVFYKGLTNPLNIAVSELTASQTFVTATNGELTKKSKSFYEFKPDMDSSQTEIKVYAIIKNDTSLLSISKFRNKSVPDPTPYFSGKNYFDHTISKQEIKEGNALILKMDNFDFDIRFRMASFTLSINYFDGKEKEIKVDGSKLSDEMLTLLGSLNTGDMVSFKNITLKGPSRRERVIQPLIFTIK